MKRGATGRGPAGSGMSVDEGRNEIARLEHALEAEVAAHAHTALALGDLEVRFRAVFDGAPIAMILVSVGTTPMLWSNRAFGELLGYAPEELLSIQPDRFIVADDRPAALEDVRQLVSGEVSSYCAERRLLHRDGRTVWAEVTVSLVCGADGVPRYLVSQIRDLTAGKRGEAELRQSEQQYHGLVEHLPSIGVLLYDPDLRCQAAYGTELDALGIDRAGLIGKSILEADASSPQGRTGTRLRAALEGTASHFEFGLGSRTYDVHIVPIRHTDGSIIAGMVVAQNITAHKEIEAALSKKSAELEAVFAALPDLFFHVDAAGRILAYNASSHLRPFVPAETFLNRFIRDVLPEHSATLLHDAAATVCHTGVPRTVEYVLPEGDAWRTYEARIWPFQTQEAIAIVRDITETRQRQAEVAHLLRVATMGEMAATLAHEVHQPLQAIINFAKGCVERMQRGRVAAESLSVPLERIADEAMRAGEIVRRMREFLRTRQPKREWTDLNQIVRSAVALAEPDAMRAGTTLTVELARALPRAFVDPIQIEQIVLNLMRNGLDALQAAANTQRELIVSTESNGAGAICIIVRDSGEGFAADVADRIFTPLFTTKPHGLGMGLSISRAIAEAHGGDLRATSTPHHGSTFTLTLPIDPGSDQLAAGRVTQDDSSVE